MGGGGFDYVQSTPPQAPATGETWYDTGTDEGKVYTSSGAWHTMSTQDHIELGGIGSGDHHTYPIPTAGLATDAVTAAKIAAGAVGATQLDGTYPNGSIATADLGFDPATQTELNNHAATAGAHHSRPTSTASHAFAEDWGTIWSGNSGAAVQEPVNGVAVAVEVTYSNSNSVGLSDDVTIENVGTYSVYVSANSTKTWQQTFAAQTIGHIRANASNNSVREIRVKCLVPGSHSHSI